MPDDETAVRLERIEYAICAMAGWLVDAQTGFGARDAQGIWAIIDGKRDEDMLKGAQNQEGEPK